MGPEGTDIIVDS